MRVAIHQPCYLPWQGYLQRMAAADLFVLLDHVQFERGNYQNRTRIRMPGDAEGRWLTVPVLQRSQQETIVEKEVDNRAEGFRRWSAVHLNTLRHAYRLAPHFRQVFPALEAVYAKTWTRLADLDIALLGVLREAFGIRTPLVRSSTLAVDGQKSDLVLAICRAVGADAFLGGMGGSRAYLDEAAFARAGIAVHWQRFAPRPHPQCGAGAFVPGLSAIDLLFNCGPEGRDLFLEEEMALAA